jgi:hypothetical protein
MPGFNGSPYQSTCPGAFSFSSSPAESLPFRRFEERAAFDPPRDELFLVLLVEAERDAAEPSSSSTVFSVPLWDLSPRRGELLH